MRDTLYEFLMLNKQLTLPGIGTITVQRESSHIDFTNRQIMPPTFHFAFDPRNDSPSKNLFQWLSASLKLSEWEAIKAVNDFSLSFKNELAEKKQVSWEKIGIFRKDGTGNLNFDEVRANRAEQPVVAEKVLRDKAEHTILVGEKERSAAEMEQYFAGTPVRRNYAWMVAVVLVVLAIMYIGWYFSEKGFVPSSAGNNAVLKSN